MLFENIDRKSPIRPSGLGHPAIGGTAPVQIRLGAPKENLIMRLQNRLRRGKIFINGGI